MPVNTQPALSGFNSSVTFFEGDVNTGGQLLDTAVSFTDPDNNFNGGHLALSGALAEDVIGIRNQGGGAGQIGISGNIVSFGGTAIGTFSGGSGSTFTVTFNGGATAAAINALIQNLTFADASNTPTASRTLTLDVFDAAGAHLTQPTTYSELTGAANPFGGFQLATASGGAPGVNNDGASPAFIDLDGDGRLDMVTGQTYGGVRAFHQNADHSFTELTGANNPIAGGAALMDSAFTTYRNSPTAVDWDGDGRTDLVVGNNGGTFTYFHHNANGTFSQLTGASNPFTGISSYYGGKPAFLDVDGDGDKDLLSVDFNGTVEVFRQNADHSLTNVTNTSPFSAINLGVSGAEIDAVDLDGDGDLDLVAGNILVGFNGSTNTLRYIQNNGNGTFTELTGAANPLAGITTVGNYTAPAFADINGDGVLDVVIGNGDGQFHTYLGTAQVGQAVAVNVTAVNDAPTASVTAANPTYTENGAAVSLFSAFSASTVESGQLFTKLVLTVTNVESGHDALTIGGNALTLVNGATSSANGITATVVLSGATATVTFSSAGTTAAVLQGLVAGLGYRYDGENPSAADRVITINSLTDNGGTANNGADTATLSLSSTVHVVPVDDGPVAVADTATVSADTSVLVDAVANDTDVDGGAKMVATIEGMMVSAGGNVMLASGALVTLNLDGTLTYDANGAFDDLGGAGSGATNTQATDTFSYALNGGSSATVTVTVDGVAGPGDALIGDGGDNVLRISSDPTSVDGGAGQDRLVIHANSHVTIADNSITGVERITVRDGATLDLSAVHDTVAGIIASLSTAGGHTTTIIGTQGDDIIVGGLGADDLSGGDGDDLIRIGATPFHIDGGIGFDRVSIVAGASITLDDTNFTGVEKVLLDAGASVDLSGVTTGLSIAAKAGLASGVSITGTHGDDIITGSDNGDTLTGGAGRDIVHGGLGADTFAFASLDDFATTGLDRIALFSRTEGDKIDLSGIDPDAILGGDQQFTFIGDAHFTGAGGTDYEVRAVDVAPGTTRLFIDIDHDANADFSFLVTTDPAITLQASDFVL